MLSFLGGFFEYRFRPRPSGAVAPTIVRAEAPAEGLPEPQPMPPRDPSRHGERVDFYGSDVGKGYLRGRTYAAGEATRLELTGVRDAARAASEDGGDVVRISRCAPWSAITGDVVAEQVRDLSLGLEVPDTEDFLEVIRLEVGPVADFHRRVGFSGPALGVVAQRTIPGGCLLCLAVGEVRLVGERDDASSEDDEDEVEPMWQLEAGDVTLLPVEETQRCFFLDRALYCNIAQCINTGPMPNAVLVHVFVNDVPMRAIMSTRPIEAGAAVVFDHNTVDWARLFPEAVSMRTSVVVVDDEPEHEGEPAPQRLAARTGRRARPASGAFRGM